MKNIFPLITLLIAATAHGQYYYNDIIVTQQINDKMKAFAAAKVQSVTATGYDQRGVKSTDFNEWQELQSGGSVLKITTRNDKSITRLYQHFDDDNRLTRTRDSTGDIQIITTYRYDPHGRIINIRMATKDSLHDFDESEEHQWQYNSEGMPEKMTRIVNGSDTTEYRFSIDEKGNPGEETMYRLYRRKDGQPVYYYYDDQKVYYYYDDQHRLTDVVRYNRIAKKLLPDFMFEYDDNNRVIQKTTTVSTTNPDYFIWRYVFDEKGLKTKEALFNKFKQLKGRIDYSYSFRP